VTNEIMEIDEVLVGIRISDLLRMEKTK